MLCFWTLYTSNKPFWPKKPLRFWQKYLAAHSLWSTMLKKGRFLSPRMISLTTAKHVCTIRATNIFFPFDQAKIRLDHPQTMLAKSYWKIFDKTNRSWITKRTNLMNSTSQWMQGWYFITRMTFLKRLLFWHRATYWSGDMKMDIFDYYFWMVCPKFITLLIQCSIPSRMIPNFPISAILGIGPFEFCCKMLYFTNTLACHYGTQHGSYPEGTQNILWPKKIIKFTLPILMRLESC